MICYILPSDTRCVMVGYVLTGDTQCMMVCCVLPGICMMYDGWLCVTWCMHGV